MLFSTDKQTIEDLNIFGRHGGGTIFSLFNRCATRGGAALLEDMFRNPLSDCHLINLRAAIIRYFAGQEVVFPVSSASFDAIDPYLANRDERTRLAGRQASLTRKLGHLLAPDAELAAIHKGIAALVGCMKAVHRFLQLPAVQNARAYALERDALFGILQEADLATVLDLPDHARFSDEQTASLDTLFRFRHYDLVQQLLRFMYKLDVYLSVARVARERGFSFGQALPAGRQVLRLEGFYHPAVPNAVANTLVVDGNPHVLFLTGANMAGKSTFMKSLSISLFLAHMGFPVAARFMEFTVLDGIYTTINLPDNLGMGASHFYAEVLRLKKVAHELQQGKRLFVVFDELFRGTNVKDAYEATVAVVKAFAQRPDSVFVISTHIIEAGDVLQQVPAIRFLYLPTRMDGNQPVYTYQLEEGITADRHGMVIIHNERILEMLEAGLRRPGKNAVQSSLKPVKQM